MNRKIISKLPPFQPITQLKRYASNKMNEKKIMLENYIVRKKKKDSKYPSYDRPSNDTN